MEARERAALIVRALDEDDETQRSIITSRQRDIDAAQARLDENQAERESWQHLLDGQGTEA